jgi:hypothetical protein
LDVSPYRRARESRDASKTIVLEDLDLGPVRLLERLEMTRAIIITLEIALIKLALINYNVHGIGLLTGTILKRDLTFVIKYLH